MTKTELLQIFLNKSLQKVHPQCEHYLLYSIFYLETVIPLFAAPSLYFDTQIVPSGIVNSIYIDFNYFLIKWPTTQSNTYITINPTHFKHTYPTLLVTF